MRVFGSTSRSLGFAIAGGVSLMLAVGCAGDKGPTLGQRIASVGESHAQLAADWEKAEAAKDQAEDDVRAAEKAIKKADKDRKKAEQALSDAQDRVRESRRAVAEAEAEAHRRGIMHPSPAN